MRNRTTISNQAKAGAKWRRWPLPLLILGFWTLPGLFYASQTYLWFENSEESFSWWRLAVWQLLIYYVWAALTPLILWLGRRFTVDRKRNLAAHILFGSVISIFHIFAYTFFTRALDLYPRWRIDFIPQFTHFIGMYFHLDFFTYCAILGAGLAFDYYHKYRENELQASKLRTQLVQAQLEALRVQIQPHFLFNTLNSIVGLIRNHENRAAIRMTTGLGELLRHVLEHPGQQEISLREELEFLERYLGIQQMRFSDRLKVEMEIDRETLNARIPSFILQPIVENAIRHGIARREAGGIINLSASRSNGHLQIGVYNDGPTLPSSWRLEDCDGIGLANTRARIEQLYGAQGRLEVRNRDECGVEATLTIPFLITEDERNGHSQKKDQSVDRG